MLKSVSRPLLAFSASLLALGGIMHTRAFPGAEAAVAGVELPAFYASSFKALWLIDSVTLLVLAAVFATVSARPAVASRAVVLLLSLIPAGTAILLYVFMGNFIPGHLLAVAAAAAFLAGILHRPSK